MNQTEYISQGTTLSFVREARECVGTRVIQNGRLKGSGLDCRGVIEHCAIATGCKPAGMPDTPSGVIPDPKQLRKLLKQYTKYVWDCEDEPGTVWRPRVKNADLLGMAVNGSKHPMHMAILVVRRDGWGIVHASDQADRVVESFLDKDGWADVRCVYRLPGLI